MKATVRAKIGGGAARCSLNTGNARYFLAVGVLKGATSDVDRGAVSLSESVAEYAAAQEFGTDELPARPFLRNSSQIHGKEWAKVLESRILARGIERGDAAIKAALEDMAHLPAADIAEGIRNETLGLKPLSPKTVQIKQTKGRPYPSIPLIDTASLIRSIRGEVREK